jgi:hypothetical protein
MQLLMETVTGCNFQVYASKTDEHMAKADYPKTLLHGSLVSLSLAAAIINGKYVNAVDYALNQEKHQGTRYLAFTYK